MSTIQLQTLYKPVGERELTMIERSGWTRFPPRIARRPVFYTDMTEDNAGNNAVQEAAYIIKFHVRKEYLKKYAITHNHTSDHDELRVPTDALEDFNNNIIGLIEVARIVK